MRRDVAEAFDRLHRRVADSDETHAEALHLLRAEVEATTAGKDRVERLEQKVADLESMVIEVTQSALALVSRAPARPAKKTAKKAIKAVKARKTQ